MAWPSPSLAANIRVSSVRNKRRRRRPRQWPSEGLALSGGNSVTYPMKIQTQDAKMPFFFSFRHLQQKL
ncbi:hypothetical protein Ddye_030961 [Dipteronia dyeriana]|uniref:Uncharacterized protein n=1 Tax=Dipteronia dyeriana TaxID=168575 RepID=A0AAD9TID4_9ROSI|nr:hypothetical protein Ddye_030961 [Dipteronia dyeriana]